jgi:predicted transcriptional regulator
MATVTIRLPDEQHDRLKRLAKARGVSVNKLIEEFSIRATTEFDVESRFRLAAVRGDAAAGLKVLDVLDALDAVYAGKR